MVPPHRPPSSSQRMPFLPLLGLNLELEYDPDNYLDRFIYETGVWEPFVVGSLGAFVRPGDICVDVGANGGYLSLMMASFAGPEGRVLSFEPQHEMVEKLRRNCDLNPTLAASIEIFPCGLGNTPGTMFISPDKGIGLGNAALSSTRTPATTHSVEVQKLDSFGLERVDCLKVDVEGMELAVLQGAEETITRCRPHLIVETLRTHPPERHKPIEDYLRSLGYRLYGLDLQAEEFVAIGYPHYPQDDTIALHPAWAYHRPPRCIPSDQPSYPSYRAVPPELRAKVLKLIRESLGASAVDRSAD